jgi:hypothetical protein
MYQSRVWRALWDRNRDTTKAQMELGNWSSVENASSMLHIYLLHTSLASSLRPEPRHEIGKLEQCSVENASSMVFLLHTSTNGKLWMKYSQWKRSDTNMFASSTTAISVCGLTLPEYETLSCSFKKGLIFLLLSKASKKLRLSKLKLRNLIKKLRLRLLPWLQFLRASGCIADCQSPYFLSDLIGNRDSEIIKISERARWQKFRSHMFECCLIFTHRDTTQTICMYVTNAN